jgi:hypothetical protein
MRISFYYDSHGDISRTILSFFLFWKKPRLDHALVNFCSNGESLDSFVRFKAKGLFLARILATNCSLKSTHCSAERMTIGDVSRVIPLFLLLRTSYGHNVRGKVTTSIPRLFDMTYADNQRHKSALDGGPDGN